MGNYKIHSTAIVESNVKLGHGCTIWSGSHIRESATLGEEVVVGENVYIGVGVRIGEKCKIQNGAQIYNPAVIGSGVFIGPGVLLTNDLYPRAVNLSFEKKTSEDWNSVGVMIGDGASIGAGAICVAPVEIGKWAMVAAGSVVIKNVPAFALVAGVPAKRIKWVGKSGVPLNKLKGNEYICPLSNEIYIEKSQNLLEIM
jgi:acetyltransferase-like isoleucine patch superfamily enzyme